MSRVIEGIVHGKTVELLEDPGVGDGQKVQVVLPFEESEGNWRDNVMRTAGALADDPDWDRIMAEIHESRKIERRSQMVEP
jgi:hypothetical protein